MPKTEDISTTAVIRENAVSEDIIEVCRQGYKFSRPGVACPVRVVYNTYANEWCDKAHYIYATSVSNALEKYDKVKHLTDEEREAVEMFFDNEPQDLYDKGVLV